MQIPFITRPPSYEELERLRLILSTFQDGSGQLATKNGRTLPGWRDFERGIALAFGGIAQESKAIFDVLIPDPMRSDISFGISCKMRGTLDSVAKTGRITLELSNAAGEFWRELGYNGLNAGNYKQDPNLVGKVILSLVKRWHDVVSIENGGNIDLSYSSYAALQWSDKGNYQLFQVPLTIPDAESLQWEVASKIIDGNLELGRSIRAKDGDGVIIEWYGEAGGQLKYYPKVTSCLWHSDYFTLEPIPINISHGILTKVALYFPDKWQNVVSK